MPTFSNNLAAPITDLSAAEQRVVDLMRRGSDAIAGAAKPMEAVVAAVMPALAPFMDKTALEGMHADFEKNLVAAMSRVWVGREQWLTPDQRGVLQAYFELDAEENDRVAPPHNITDAERAEIAYTRQIWRLDAPTRAWQPSIEEERTMAEALVHPKSVAIGIVLIGENTESVGARKLQTFLRAAAGEAALNKFVQAYLTAYWDAPEVEATAPQPS